MDNIGKLNSSLNTCLYLDFSTLPKVNVLIGRDIVPLDKEHPLKLESRYDFPKVHTLAKKKCVIVEKNRVLFNNK